MATEGSHCNTRMSAQYEEKYNSLKKTAGELFKKYKVEISNAINKAFPLFEILRDRGFITNEKYKESRESLIKRISVQEAVYDILSELEKTFDLTLLGALFSKAIMENYPDLKDSYRIFKKEMPDIKDFLETDAENKGQSDAQPSLDQGSGKNSCLNLLWSSPFSMNNTDPATSDNRLTQQASAEMGADTTTGSNAALESQQASEQCAQQSEPAGAELLIPGIPVNSGPTDPANIKKEKPFFNSGVDWEAQGRTGCNQASAIIEISNEDSVERRNREEAPEVSTSGVKRKPGTVNPENNSTPGIKKKKKRQQPDVPVNFEAEILPVTCKKKTGLLIKRKLERGATRKCIRTEDGNWFTPREFEVRAGYEKANNWRNSLTCGGKTLKLLIELKYIHPPPTTKKVENSDKCVICQDGGKLFGCATCHKVFHEGCHIPPVEIARSGWKCTFCLTRNPPSHQHYRESEVLVKLMEPEELLKCAFLLLIVYASLEGKVFPNIPHENYAKEASQCLEKLRKLDKIKESLLKENYHSVESFVRAMDEFFTIPSCSDAELTQDDFKKNFKEQFAIQETN
ncbi:nuclear body protein SP140-like protein isoform X2 [Artibeus jamaicensis]|uniref:nuclear body protein SP140-like protein isoform X2 n=1 Tax=Artibeus jamaicensis TaxID=9417 RepID=UPI00235A8F8B|nr:nuclear body protein SP140-like protein isoform X2 [Artibeus jamaicensis]